MRGESLANAYEEIVRCSLMDPTPEDVSGVYGVVLANLEKLYEDTLDYNTDQREQLARGMALKVRELDIEHVVHEPNLDDSIAEDDDDEDDDWGELKLSA